jgi:general secretion pathway protein H
MSATGSRSDAGATLIEMLVVVGILGLITALVFPAWNGALRRAQLYEARATLVDHLRTARADAVRGGQAIDLELSDDGGGYGWERSRAELPLGVAIEATPRAVRFFADGSSSGGELWLTWRDRRLEVQVDPASGLVEAPPG